MAELSRTEMERYLKSVIGPSARVLNLKVLGESEEKDIKGYGYGTPVQIDYECDGKQQRAVLHTISPGPFGHEHMNVSHLTNALANIALLRDNLFRFYLNCIFVLHVFKTGTHPAKDWAQPILIEEDPCRPMPGWRHVLLPSCQQGGAERACIRSRKTEPNRLSRLAAFTARSTLRFPTVSTPVSGGSPSSLSINVNPCSPTYGLCFLKLRFMKMFISRMASRLATTSAETGNMEL